MSSRQIGGIVGAVIGAVAAYYTGDYELIALGYSAGSGAQALIAPPRLYGPRLEDLRNQTSSYGVDIPERWGDGRQAGNVIWQTDLIQNEVETSSKGGQDTTNYKYTFHTAIGICKGPILGIARIWANKKVLYDARPTNTGPLSDPKIGTVRIYLGNETQEADPLIEAISGPGTPAYRGLAYVVLENVDGTDTQGRIQWEFEVIADGSAAVHYTNVCALTSAERGNPEAHGWSWIGGPQGQTIYWWRRSDNPTNSPYNYFRSLDGGPIEFIGADSALTALVTDKVAVNTRDWPCYANVYSRNSPSLDGGVTRQPIDIRFPNGDSVGRTICNSVILNSYNSLSGNGNLFAYDQDSDLTVISKRGTSGALFFCRYVVLYTGGTPFYGGIPVQVIGFDDQSPGVHALASTEVACAVAAANGKVFVLVNDGTRMNLRILSQDDASVLADFAGPVVTPDYGTDIQESIRTDGTKVWAWCGNGGLVWRWDADGTYRMLATGIEVKNDAGAIIDGLGGNQIYIDDASLVQQSESATLVVGSNNVFRIERAVFAAPSAATVPLSTIVSDLCLEAGLAAGDIDVTALNDQVSGYTRPRNMTVRAALEPLQQAYFFDAVESDFKLKFVKRGTGTPTTIPLDDRAAYEEGQELPDHLKVVRINELEGTNLVDVDYVDASADFLIGNQYDRRLTKAVVSSVDLKLPLNLTADQAKAIASTTLYASWLTQTYQFTTARKYGYLEPTDQVLLPTENATYLARITKKTEHASGVIEWEAIQEDPAVYSRTGVGTPLSFTPTSLQAIPRTQLNLLDIPILQDADDDFGIYGKATPIGSPWPGSSVTRNDGGAPSVVGTVTSPGVVGVAVSALADYAGIDTFDESHYLDVYVAFGTLVSVPRAQALAGANAFLVGNGTSGQEEIIVARDVALIATKTYRLSGLLRKRKGTPGSYHAIGDRVVKLDMPGLIRIPNSPGDISVDRKYSAITFGRRFDGSDQKTISNTAIGLRPLPPVQLGGGTTSTGDVFLNWRRQTRYSAPLRNRTDAPLGETSERYDIEIAALSSFATVARTIYVTSPPPFSYQVGDRTADGISFPFYWRVSQRSERYGRGQASAIARVG